MELSAEMSESIDIHKAIPHRPPFLFIDEVLEVGDDRIRALKTVEPDLDFFRGHYPHFPVMPGVLACECVFQAGAVLLSRNFEPESSGSIPALARIKNARFKRMIRPGDRLLIEAQVTDRLGGVFYMKGSVKVDDELAVEVSFTCVMAPMEGGK